MFRNIYYHLSSQMSQTLQNQLLLAKSMNSIISLSDGAGTTITNGSIVTNDLSGSSVNATTVNAGSLNTGDLNLTGSLQIPAVNDITTPYFPVSFYNTGRSYYSGSVYFDGLLLSTNNFTSQGLIISAGTFEQESNDTLNPSNPFGPVTTYNNGKTLFGDNVYISEYLAPYFPLSSTSYRIGMNAMQYMSSLTSSSIAIGANCMRGTVNSAFNQMPQSVVIGHNAFSSPYQPPTSVGISYNNVIIGDNCCKVNNNDKDCVIIGGQCCSSNNQYSNSNSVVLGANIGTVGNAFGAGYNDSVIIGSNLLLKSGMNSGIIIGANAFKNSTFNYGNGPCVVGYNSALNVLAFNRLTIFGNDSGKNINVDVHNMILGPEAGNNMISNVYCSCIGGFSNASNALVSSTALGVNCSVGQSHTLKAGGNDGALGGLGFIRHQDLLIPQKNRLLCATIAGAVASLTPQAESGEYIFINSATTTSITLPTPAFATTGSQNISNFGARFTIIRIATGTSNITVNAPSGQFIIFNGAASSTYAFNSSESYVSFVCCNNGAGNSTWAVESSQQVLNGYVDLISNQNISGIKTFLSAPVLSGASITANTIGQTQVNNGYVDLTSAQSVGGIKTYTSPPVMSGASITANTIGQTQVNNGYVDLTSPQSVGGIKTFTSAQSNSSQLISGTGTQTFSITGGRDVILANSGITQITLPVVASGNVGQTFQILKSTAFTATVNIVPQAGSTIFANNASATNIYIAITCNSFTITATSTTNWVMYNNDNPEMTIQSKNIYPLSGKMDLAALPNLGAITTISIGNSCLTNCPSAYRNAYSVAIGNGCLNALTGLAQGMVCIGNNCMLSSTSNLIQNTTAIGSAAGAAYAITGGSNTLIGAATDFASGGTYNYSTALGYGAIITGSNQVILGRNTETVIMPSAKVQYGTYQPHSVYQTIHATSLDWNASPPTPLSKTVLFSCSSTTIVTLTLPSISNAAIFEGFEFQFRRTNTFASATTTSQLIALCSGTDTIYIQGAMTTAPSIFALASGAFYSRLVCVNKTTTPYNWAYFP